MRDLNSINQEIAQLRAQATALHTAAASTARKVYVESTEKLDIAAQQAAEAHAAAKQMQSQAARERKNADDYRTQADEYDADAAKLASAGDAKGAEEARENAGGMRAWAAGAAEQAEKAEQQAAQQSARAEQWDAEVQRLKDDDGPLPHKQLEDLADKIDDKVRLLEEAAKSERQAIVAEMDGDGGAVYTARQMAEFELGRADAIDIDYGSVDAKVLHDAGINLSELPGSELLDASAEAAADTVGAARYDEPVSDDALSFSDDAGFDAIGDGEPGSDSGFADFGSDSDTAMGSSGYDDATLISPDDTGMDFGSDLDLGAQIDVPAGDDAMAEFDT